MPQTERPLENVEGVMHVPKTRPRATDTGLGWLVYAAAMLALSATLNIVWGTIQLADNQYFGDSLTRPQVELWGWVWIGLGVFELTLAMGVLVENGLALLLALGVALVNLGLHIPALGAHHPGWAAVTLAADALVVYAVAAPWFRGRH